MAMSKCVFICLSFGLVLGSESYPISNTEPADLVNATPAPQDQCMPTNASMPIECPAHVGPPCPYCYTNYESDYTTGSNLNFTDTELATIELHMSRWIEYWQHRYPPTLVEPSGDYSVFTGLAGRAQLFLRVYLYTNNDTYLQLSKQYITTALQTLPQKQEYSSYFYGHVGVWTVASMISYLYNDSDGVMTYWKNIQNTFAEVNTAIETKEYNSTPFDLSVDALDQGLSGLLYTGMLLNEWFAEQVIDPNVLKNITYFIISSGVATGQALGHDWLMYQTPNVPGCYDWGM
ncbi:hypothetical protein RFI_10244, partial [Reticulomyxa filosa]